MTNILKPFRYADEQVLRLYTQFAKKIEKKGISRYPLAILGSFAGGFLSFCGFRNYLPAMNNSLFAVAYSQGIISPEFIRGVWNYRFKRKTTDDVKVKVPYGAFGEFGNWSSKYTRLPLMLASLGFGGKALVEAYTGFVNNDSGNLLCALNNAQLATGLFGMSSSRYLNDADSDILKKEPFYKTAFDWAKKKVESLTPNPAPQPIPVRVDSASRLEEKLKF